jgi:hypothetical protein
MDGNKLMQQACRFARTHESEVFRAACLWEFPPNMKGWNLKTQRVEWNCQTAQGYWEEWVIDSCLDILAGRMPLYLEFEDETGRFKIYLVHPLTYLTPPQLWKRAHPDEWQEKPNDAWG